MDKPARVGARLSLPLLVTLCIWVATGDAVGFLCSPRLEAAAVSAVREVASSPRSVDTALRPSPSQRDRWAVGVDPCGIVCFRTRLGAPIPPARAPGTTV